ncbi:alpha/beta hydrolase [Variovorax sp.]|uniref:alpha/beta hydrolase n=1 Tax=Variovorax sp. TaxID=1871043 RepID=UPI003BA8CB8E
MTRTFRFHAALAPAMLALAALWLPAGGALAQAFDPIRPIGPGADRAALAAEAAAAARAGNAYGNVEAERPLAAPRTGGRDRAAVRAEAVAASHDPSLNLDRRAFVNSEIPPQIKAVPGTPRTGR